MKTSEAIDQISTAMSLAQGETNPALKMTTNPFFKSKYANLNQIWDAVKIPLSKNKLSVFQDLITTERGVAVTTRICHASGQWIEFGPLDIPSVKKDAQGLGSAASYGRRYALAAALGVVSDEDDDGNEASKPCPPSKPTVPQRKLRDEQLVDIVEWVGDDKEWGDKILKAYNVSKLSELPESAYGPIKQRHEERSK